MKVYTKRNVLIKGRKEENPLEITIMENQLQITTTPRRPLGMQTWLDHLKTLAKMDAEGYACRERLKGKAVFRDPHEK